MITAKHGIEALARPVRAGEFVRFEDLEPFTTKEFSALVRRGQLAVSIAVSAESAVSFLIAPKDRVDVYVVRMLTDPAAPGGRGSETEVVGSDLEVFAVDNLVQDSGIGTSEVRRGTRVVLTFVAGHVPRLEDVFAAFTDPESLAFARTRATIRLAAFGKTLVARSEAKRLVARFAEFTHVTLDFTGVDVVGQGFCDEVFRVFARAHPGVVLEPVGMNDGVAFMVARARAAAR